MNCIICTSELTGKKTLYCGKNCMTKGWKVQNREKYLEGKRLYRIKHKDKVLAYNRVARKLTPEMKSDLRKLFGVCARCGENKQLEIHHIKDIKYGGNNELNNLIALCISCHNLWHIIFKDFWRIDKP